MSDQLLHLSLTPQRLDYIAQVLAQRPWAEADPVLQDIRQQVARQQAQQPAPAPTIAANGHDPVSAPHFAAQ